MKKIKNLVISLLWIGGITFILLEGILYLVLNNPKISIFPLDVARKIYIKELRHVIQADPACARYDEYVSYTLRPGTCKFNNVEFSTTYHINSAGLRDSEQALAAPAIIALGDSFTMGWGVEQDEPFPELIERATGLKALNAGISSFATARALRLLERLDTSNLKYLIIQYSDNDLRENQLLHDNGALSITAKEKWEEASDSHLKHISYFPGRYSLIVLFYAYQWFVGENAEPSELAADTNPQEAEYFLTALKSSGYDFNKFKVIIFEINGYNNNDDQFIDQLERLIDNRTEFNKDNFVFLRLKDKLTDDMYFRYDDHINSVGHVTLAQELMKWIDKE